MLNKIIIGALVVLLIVMVGMFLYSSQPVSPTLTPEPQSSMGGNNTGSHNVSDNSDTNNTVMPDTVPQPDKALPIPAHQLKKIIADKPQNDELEQNLEQRIQKANQAIAALEQSLPDDVKTQNIQVLNEKPQAANSAQVNVSDQRIDEINQRLEHLRNHLDKKAEMPAP
jgi:hypothetical protein